MVDLPSRGTPRDAAESLAEADERRSDYTVLEAEARLHAGETRRGIKCRLRILRDIEKARSRVKNGGATPMTFVA